MTFSSRTYLFSTLISLLLLGASAAPSPRPTVERRQQFPGYTITSFLYQSVHGNKQIQFSIHDGTPADNATRLCSTQVIQDIPGFKEGDSIPCRNSTGQIDRSFQWKNTSASASGFAIQASHSYNDESLGPCAIHDGVPVFCGVRTWAKGNITSADLTCTKHGNQTSSVTRCKANKDIHLTVYQAIA